ncbi:MAG: hypothetical protein Q9208_003269 [Pyrenodesmia sp. 3 TL-2023]
MANRFSKLKQLVETRTSQYNTTEALRKLNQGLVFIGDQAKNVDFTNLAKTAGTYTLSTVRENPGKTSLTVVALGLGPLSSLLLPWAGFGAAGVTAGSIASALHSQHAPVVAHGIFATLQSAGAGGYGLPIVQGAVQGAATAMGAGPWVKTVYDKLKPSADGQRNRGVGKPKL